MLCNIVSFVLVKHVAHHVVIDDALAHEVVERVMDP